MEPSCPRSRPAFPDEMTRQIGSLVAFLICLLSFITCVPDLVLPLALAGATQSMNAAAADNIVAAGRRRSILERGLWVFRKR